MGGRAFAALSPPLPTPRMPPEVYALVLSSCHRILREHYSRVDSPIEAPGKETYGDVDILVFGPSIDENAGKSTINKTDNASVKFSYNLDNLDPHGNQTAANLGGILGAKKWITERGNPTINFAIPWPVSQADSKGEDRYVQIDVKICHSLEVFNWEVFHAAHGDLWNILGSNIRKLGLTVNNHGMHLRIPEIEIYDRKKSMIFLTQEPGRILQFLGLDEERWRKPFESKEAMFLYAAGSKTFWIKDNEDESLCDGYTEGQEGDDKGKKKLKHNDRQRMAQRTIFRDWIEEFIPRCREQGLYQNRSLNREQIRDEAFQFFGNGVNEEYQTRLRQWELAKHREHLWRDTIKGCVPVQDVDFQFRAAAIRTLKSVILEGDVHEVSIPEAPLKNEEGFYDVEGVRSFVIENWKMAGEIGMKKQQKRAAEGMRAKAEMKQKRQLEEEEDRKRKRLSSS